MRGEAVKEGALPETLDVSADPGEHSSARRKTRTYTDMVYSDAPQSIQELKAKIRAVIDEIELQMCENLMKNVIKRAWSCERNRGSYVNYIVFHY